jgi:hypothetical protein
MNRRAFLAGLTATASGLLIPEPVRAYAFLNPAWMGPLTHRLPPATGVEGDIVNVYRFADDQTRALLIKGAGAEELFRFASGVGGYAEFVQHNGVWRFAGSIMLRGEDVS